VPRERPRTYTSVGFEVPPRMVEDAGGMLIADGALGCEVREIPRRAHSSSGRTSVLLRAYFQRITPSAIKRLQVKLQVAGMLANGSMPEQRVLVDPGWATMWQARFEPLRIGRRLLIVPPWAPEPDRNRICLVIRPGQAFGTGHHVSTSGTLSALEEICQNYHVTHALDVGTGSGLLAIAMVKMGVGDVTAVDTDAMALANARENATLNQIQARIRFSATPLNAIRGRFGLIAVNSLSSTIIQMAPDLKKLLRSHGHLVLSGILRREAETVADAYVTELACVGWRNHRAWTTLIFQK
jgi:ribosomal protein L11 methyltransferase